MGGILYTILIGAVIGALARLIKPGADPMGWILTILLGIAGSFTAGLVGQLLGWYHAGEGAGFIASVIAAIALLVLYGRLRGGPPAGG